ncbi:hypothetical protein K9M42_02720 [Patescibacteria group bacterium]|nr:hypothetical protein [Patescibacteria group bacterium]
MIKKKYLFIILFGFVFLFLISYLIINNKAFFINIKNNITKETNHEYDSILDYDEKISNDDVNLISNDNDRYCKYNKECFKEAFLNCNNNNYMHYFEKSYYLFDLTKFQNDCYLTIKSINGGNYEKACFIPLTETTENTLNKFLNLDQTTLDKYCK